MTWAAPGPRLSTELKTVLDEWVDLVEDILASASTCVPELTLWIEAMGFKMVGGVLSVPASTGANIWDHLEDYWQEQSVYYSAYTLNIYNARYGLAPPNQSRHQEEYINTFSFPGLTALRQRWYFPAKRMFAVLNDLFDSVSAALKDDEAYLRSHVSGFDAEFAVGGLLVLFDYFVIWSAVSTAGGNIYIYLPENATGESMEWANATIGPYTVSVYYCENGVIRSMSVDPLKPPEFAVVHQSVDADILLQDEEQVELAASQLLSAKVPSELDADEVLQARVDTELSAELPLRGEVQLTPLARLALRDKVMTSLDADEWLAATHQSPFDAAERLAAIPRIPLDADICIQGPVPLSITARMLLEPDFESEMLTDLERLHIQKYRIVADPRSYIEYNSEKDVEVVP